MERAELEALDDRITGCWDAADPDGFVELLADDFVWYDWTMPEPMRDRDTARTYFASWITAVPDMRTTAKVRIVGDGAIATEIEWTGTQTGPFVTPQGELPPTGATLHGRGVYFAYVRDGRIAEFRSHPDVAGILAQLGVGQPA